MSSYDEDPYGLFEPRPPRPSRTPSFFPAIQQTPNPTRSADTIVSADGEIHFPLLNTPGNYAATSRVGFLLRESTGTFAAAAAPPSHTQPPFPAPRRRR